MRSHRHALLGASATIAILAAAPALAQTAAPATAEPQKSDTTMIEEVLVTATRTQTNLQTTPVSVQVYSAEAIAEKGITTVQQLANADASINIGYSTNQPIVAVRGVSSSNATEIGDPAISVGFDSTFTNRPYGMLGGMYDIARVEILRGPQGTLFGRNSTGGTLNIITARPTANDEGKITVDVGNYAKIGADGFMNFALSEKVQARASFLYRNHDGYRNIYPAKARGDDEDIKAARLQLAFQPTDHLSGWILAARSHEGGVGLVNEIIPFTYKVSFADGEPLHTKPTTQSDGKTYPAYAQNLRDLRSSDIRGGLTYEFDGGVTLNYTGSYNFVKYRRITSGNASRFQIPPRVTPAVFVPITTPQTLDALEKPSTYNNELRIAGPTDGRFTWQAGAYAFEESNTIASTVSINPGASNQMNAIQFDFPDVSSKSKAVFAHVTYNLTEQLKLSLGGRKTWDDKSRTGFTRIFPLQTGAPVVINSNGNGSYSSSRFTWLAGLDYQITPVNMLYGKVSTGYKAGGFNSAAVVIPYGPEKVTSYEVGSKNRFLDNSLQVNLAAYYLDYKDQQVSTFIADPLGSGSRTVNAGSSEIYGLESNIEYATEAFGRLSISANYLHARYKSFLTVVGWNTTINQDLTGNRLPLSPTFTATVGYERPLNLASGATLTPSINVKYESAKFFQPENYASSKQDAYALVDAALIYKPADGNWSVQGYVKNIFDEVVLVDAGEFYTGKNYTYAYQPPRTYGLRVSMDF